MKIPRRWRWADEHRRNLEENGPGKIRGLKRGANVFDVLATPEWAGSVIVDTPSGQQLQHPSGAVLTLPEVVH
jgi:hypothetical protein